MAPTRKLQGQLFREMRARIQLSEEEEEEDIEAADADGGLGKRQQRPVLAEAGGDGFVYYTRRPPGANFPIYCRRREGEGNGEEVLLDQNVWPDFYQGHMLGDAKVSPRQGRLAFVLGAPEKGGRGWTLYVQDLLPASRAWWTVEGDGWAGVGPSFEWGPAVGGSGGAAAEGEEMLYYTKVDEHGRPHEAWAAYLPLAQGPPRGLSRPPQRVLRLDPVEDRAFFLTATRTKDRRFVTLAATSKATSEVWLLPGPSVAGPVSDAAAGGAAAGETSPRLFCPRRPGIQYFVDHGGESFFIVASEGPGEEYCLYTLPTGEGAVGASSLPSSSSSWRRCLPAGDEDRSSIEDMDLFQRFCVLYERSHEAGAPALTVLDRRDASLQPHRPVLPAETASGKLQPGLNQDYTASRVRFSATSPILPDVTYEYHLAERRLVELHRERLPGRPPLDPAGRYSCQRVLVPSSSSAALSSSGRLEAPTIPLTLAHRRDVQPGAGQLPHPVLLLGYGAYGVSLSVSFRPELLPLLERGWVLAFAHVRGGGEKGRRWHAQGKGPHKLNSLLDYLRCADWLVEEGWTRPGLIAGHGASAGALVVAGAAHRRPELFGSLVLKVPFLDLSRTMADPALPLTVHEYDEWGDPRDDPAVAARLAELSPYDTLPPAAPCFPPTLLLASLADDRVKAWEAAKYAAKARRVRLLLPGPGPAGSGRHPEVLLRMEGDRGHEGPPSQAEMLQEAALEQAFVLTRMGLGVDRGTGVAGGKEEGVTGGGNGDSGRRVPGRRRRGGGGRERRERCLPPVPPLVFY